MDAFADQETRGCLDRRHGRQHHPDIGHRRARVFPPLELGLGGTSIGRQGGEYIVLGEEGGSRVG
jgi:hypothetical protein